MINYGSVKSNRSLIIAVVAVFLCLAIILAVILVPKSTSLKYDIVYGGISGDGIVIRDEKFINLSEYEKVYFNNVINGQYIEEGSLLVTAYKKGYIKNTIEKLSETEKNIVTYQNQSVINDFDDKVIKDYDFRIDVIIRNMSEKSESFIELHGELSKLMRERESYIRDTYNTESDTYLVDLYEDEAMLIESLSTWCDALNAELSGFIGLYCDGYETAFNVEEIDNVGYQDLSDFVKDYSSSELNGYKIVNDSSWRIAVKVDDAELFTVGEYYSVYIGNSSEAEFGKIERVAEGKRGSYLIILFDDNVEKCLNIRVTDVFIGERFEGFSVKSSFVKNGEVIVKDGKDKKSVSVKIVYQDKDITLFEVDDSFKLGQKVYNK